MLPLPPPFPFRRLLLVAALTMSGCFQSTLPGGDLLEPSPEPSSRPLPDLPRVSVGRTFELFGVDGRCVADGWRLEIDGDGNAQSLVEEFGVTDASGEARGTESHVFVSLGATTLELLRVQDEWSGYELWHAFQDGDLIAWAVELPPRVEAPAGLPSFRACAAFEQWSLHELEGGTSHVEAVVDIDGASWRRDEGEFPLWLDIESDGRVLFRDARLPLREDGAESGEISAEVISWDGTEGVARVRNSIGLCSAGGGEIIFRLVGDEIHVMQSWFVIDAMDRDDDGDHEERHLRRTRSVLSRSACPRSLSR
ncbi:MAG: hypothetical protein ACI9KE_005863 [Polyangiales bacterium]|jgi:hypothetical protein